MYYKTKHITYLKELLTAKKRKKILFEKQKNNTTVLNKFNSGLLTPLTPLESGADG